MGAVKELLKKETVFCVSFVMALISSVFVRPDLEYIYYPDYRTISLLFCLMLVVAGLQAAGLFSALAGALLKRLSSLRSLSVAMTLMCFFSSMIITNDVTLITFVPFTIMVFGIINKENKVLKVIVLETVAANLGSMATPIGNPQNLYLYSVSGIDMASFAWAVMPYTALSFILLILSFCRDENEKVYIKGMEDVDMNKMLFSILPYIILLFICLLVVFRVISYIPALICVLAVVLAVNKKLFKSADYFLLFTFLFFFIFIGNIKRIPQIRDMLVYFESGRELIAGILASQIISNVPAAILLSGFTDNFGPLITGVNIGGLGTIIASLASLISFKFFAKAYPNRKGDFMRSFSFWNVAFLALLTGLALFIS